jgi:hypothetical protein
LLLLLHWSADENDDGSSCVAGNASNNNTTTKVKKKDGKNDIVQNSGGRVPKIRFKPIVTKMLAGLYDTGSRERLLVVNFVVLPSEISKRLCRRSKISAIPINILSIILQIFKQ